jgi:hypothetical protein
MERMTGTHRGFGLTFACNFPLPGLPGVASAREPDLDVTLAAEEELDVAWSGPAREPATVQLTLDGLPYRAERGAAGDHRFSYGDSAAFHLSGDARRLRCAPADVDEPAWRRVLLDSVLATVALLHGFEALHAAAVAGPTGTVAFIAHTGGGKSTLVAELMRRGLPLVCDDVLALSRDASGAIIAHPAPPVMNLPHAAPPLPARRLATFGEEDWVAVEQAAAEPAPLAAVCMLDRRPGLDAAIRPAEASALDLLAHGLRTGRAAARMQARFELLADLAEQAPGFVLEADPRTPPGRLADLADSAIPALRTSTATAGASL